MRVDWIKWAWCLGFLVAVPGLLIYLGYRWFSLLVLPTLSLPFTEVLNKPVIDIVVAVLFFFGGPSLFMLALMSFAVGVRILVD